MEHVADEVLSSGNFSLCETFSSPTDAFGDKKELQEPGKEKWPNLENRRIHLFFVVKVGEYTELGKNKNKKIGISVTFEFDNAVTFIGANFRDLGNRTFWSQVTVIFSCVSDKHDKTISRNEFHNTIIALALT